MTTRKYLVTIHEDGSISALEFEDPADQALTNYQAGSRDAVNSIISILTARRAKCYELASRYGSAGSHGAWRQAMLSATVTAACIEAIKDSFHLS